MSVTKTCDVVEFGASPVIATLKGGVTLAEFPDPSQFASSWIAIPPDARTCAIA